MTLRLGRNCKAGGRRLNRVRRGYLGLRSNRSQIQVRPSKAHQGPRGLCSRYGGSRPRSRKSPPEASSGVAGSLTATKQMQAMQATHVGVTRRAHKRISSDLPPTPPNCPVLPTRLMPLRPLVFPLFFLPSSSIAQSPTAHGFNFFVHAQSPPAPTLSPTSTVHSFSIKSHLATLHHCAARKSSSPSTALPRSLCFFTWVGRRSLTL